LACQGKYQVPAEISTEKLDAAIGLPKAMLALRKARNWSQYELATELGTRERNVQRWEAGTDAPPWAVIKMIQLCPNERVQSNFWNISDNKPIDNDQPGSKMGGTEQQKQGSKHAKRGPKFPSQRAK
jgi:DNA-binding transcriptional regulator YiaG